MLLKTLLTPECARPDKMYLFVSTRLGENLSRLFIPFPHSFLCTGYSETADHVHRVGGRTGDDGHTNSVPRHCVVNWLRQGVWSFSQVRMQVWCSCLKAIVWDLNIDTHALSVSLWSSLARKQTHTHTHKYKHTDSAQDINTNTIHNTTRHFKLWIQIFVLLVSLSCLFPLWYLNTPLLFEFREAKQHASPVNFAEVIPEFGSIYAAKCNCNASKVAVIVNKVRAAST